MGDWGASEGQKIMSAAAGNFFFLRKRGGGVCAFMGSVQLTKEYGSYIPPIIGHEKCTFPKYTHSINLML